MAQTVELPRVGGPGSGMGATWRVIVLNDDFNTFDHVAETLASVIPGVTRADGYRLGEKIHNTGQALVWPGAREEAGQYGERLDPAGLTMAPLGADYRPTLAAHPLEPVVVERESPRPPHRFDRGA